MDNEERGFIGKKGSYKEIYPQRDFIENLHPMDEINLDKVMVTAYEGRTTDAPPSAIYVYNQVINSQNVEDSSFVLQDDIDGEVVSYTLNGNTATNDLKTIGTYNGSTNKYDTIITVNQTNYKISTSQPLCSLPSGAKDICKDNTCYYTTAYKMLSPYSNWEIENVYSNNNIIVISLYTMEAGSDTVDIYCNKFEPVVNFSSGGQIKIANNRIYISANRTDIGSFDEFMNWLNRNDVIVIFKRKRVISMPLERPIHIIMPGEEVEITNDQNAILNLTYRVAPNAILYKRNEETGSFEEITK